MADFAGHVRKLIDVPDQLTAPITTALAEAVRRDAGFWNKLDAGKPNRFQVFDGSTQHVVFKFPKDLRDHTAGSRVYENWATWGALIEPVISHVNNYYRYRNGTCARVMLAKLRAGGVIAKHIDGSNSAKIPHKIHVPLITHPLVEFWEDDKTYFLETGSAYEVNNRIPHGGQNLSPIDRIHLIYDFFESS